MRDLRDRFRDFNSGRANFYLVAVITCILAGAMLKITASVFIPFIIAVLLALVIHPLTKIPQKFRFPRMIPILLAVIIIIAGLFSIGVVLFSSGRTLLSLFPKYEDRLNTIYSGAARLFDLPYDEHRSFIQNLWSQLGIRSRISYMTFSFSNYFISFLKDAVMVVLFLVFLLFEAAFFKDKIKAAFMGKSANQIEKIGAAMMQQISRYLSIKFIISLATGIVVTVGLRFIGLEFSVLWGVIQFILNFIPSLGSIAAGFAASIFALIQFWPEPAPVAAVVAVMLGANMIIGNILEPKIMGDNLGISPIVVLLSLMLWGFIWGFAGMVLAVPMMVIIKIICENFPVLEPISIILGSRKAVLAKKTELEEESAKQETE
jgi:predicted PurR-regulated permease PerM